MDQAKLFNLSANYGSGRAEILSLHLGDFVTAGVTVRLRANCGAPLGITIHGLYGQNVPVLIGLFGACEENPYKRKFAKVEKRDSGR